MSGRSGSQSGDFGGSIPGMFGYSGSGFGSNGGSTPGGYSGFGFPGSGAGSTPGICGYSGFGFGSIAMSVDLVGIVGVDFRIDELCRLRIEPLVDRLLPGLCLARVLLSRRVRVERPGQDPGRVRQIVGDLLVPDAGPSLAGFGRRPAPGLDLLDP